MHSRAWGIIVDSMGNFLDATQDSRAASENSENQSDARNDTGRQIKITEAVCQQKTITTVRAGDALLVRKAGVAVAQYGPVF
jgi:hypothetical protein